MRLVLCLALLVGAAPLAAADVVHLKTGRIGPAVHNAADRFRSLLAEGEVSFSVAVESELEVSHDPAAIKTVILNLLTNNPNTHIINITNPITKVMLHTIHITNTTHTQTNEI